MLVINIQVVINVVENYFVEKFKSIFNNNNKLNY